MRRLPSRRVTIAGDGTAWLCGVCVLGAASKNFGRTYSAEAIAAAVPLYDRAAVSYGHGPGTRRLLGRLVHPRLQAGQLVGDVLLYRQHPRCAAVIESALRADGRLGLSHDARGDTAGVALHEGQHYGAGAVRRITSVRSVDVVDRPATTGGFYLRPPPLYWDGHVMSRRHITALLEGRLTRRRFVREQDDLDDEAADARISRRQAGAIEELLRDQSLTAEERLVKIAELIGADLAMAGRLAAVKRGVTAESRRPRPSRWTALLEAAGAGGAVPPYASG